MRRLEQRFLIAVAALILAACGGGSPPRNPDANVGVGACCGDASCQSNTCTTGLHCGNTQTPYPVVRCCEVGKYCCGSDVDCQAYLPGVACDTASSACFTACTGNDDSQCTAGFHCSGTACVANLAEGAACLEPSDCASRNCSENYASSGLTCAPAGTCADGANPALPVGYTLCSGNTSFRTCTAAGLWSAETANAHPAGETCDAGGGATSGFRAAGVCTSGLAADLPGFSDGCRNCAPFKATVAGCIANCGNDDAICVAGFHCAQGAGGVCATNANGGRCDNGDPGDCSSGRCDPDPVTPANFTCQAALPNTSACDEDSDCLSTRCDAGSCKAQLADTTVCTRDADCLNKNCSADYDTSSRFCAPPSTCFDSGAGSYPVGFKVCSGSGATTASRLCQAQGLWAARSSYTPTTCNGGMGSNSGYVQVASCVTGSAPTNGLQLSCHSCGNYGSNATFNGCFVSCAVGGDASCAYGAYCASGACTPDLANGVSCTSDAMCVSGRCDGTCMDQLPDGENCDEASDCISFRCNGICLPPLSSCPLVYAYDGVAFSYVTDTAGTILGRARFATRVALYKPVYLVLHPLVSSGPTLDLKIRETLNEISYVDQAVLVSVDVPMGCELASSTSENTYGLGYVNPFELTTACRIHLPVSAVDMTGADVLPQLSGLDDVIGTGVPTQSARYELDFGPGLDVANAKLLIDGWAMYGAAYNSSGRLASTVEVGDGAGGWTMVKSFGYPDGDLKTLAISLDGKLRADDPRVRVRVGYGPAQKWAIDRIRLDDSPPTGYSRADTLPSSATLYDAGRATLELASFDGRGTASDDRQPVDPSMLGTGAFTRYGDVTELLSTLDDMHVVMRHGDGVSISYPDDAPPPVAGTRRIHLLKVKVYYKEFESSRDADPLPFSAMSSYPPPAGEAYPSDPAHDAYRATYNTRVYPP